MKRLALVVLLAIPLTCSAAEYKFDFGTIEGGACSNTESETGYSSSSTEPVQEQTYSRKLTRLVATVVAEPDSDEVAEVVNACGAKAAKALRKTRSTQNMGPFSDLFEKYISSCVSQMNSDITIQYAAVEYEEKCEK
jgi:hypothetical protein